MTHGCFNCDHLLKIGCAIRGKTYGSKDETRKEIHEADIRDKIVRGSTCTDYNPQKERIDFT